MKTIERIKQLTDNEKLSLYQGFSGFLFKGINVEQTEIIKNIPEELSNQKELKSLSNKDLDDLDVFIKPNEVIPVVTAQLEYWAEDKDIAPLLDDYMNSNPIHEMAAGVILAIGAVLITTLITSSLKIDRKNGKTTFSYGTINISDNAIKLVNAVLTSIAGTVKNVLT